MVDRFAINIDGCHLRMASRYISRRYGSTSASQSRSSSQVEIDFITFSPTFDNNTSLQIRETVSTSSSQQSRARSIAPLSSMSSSSEQDSLMRYYSGYLDTGARARARASQPRELGTQESAINKVRERDIMGIMQQLQKKSVVGRVLSAKNAQQR